MSAKDKFTPEEWKTLLKTPMMIGFAVVGASPSGAVGFVKEMAAIAESLIEGGKQAAPDSLIGSVITEIRADPKALVEERKERPTVEEARINTLEACRQVARILGAKASAQESDAYKRWLLALGSRVAEASKEGGFLGIGGERVSGSEAAVLAEISSALEMTRHADQSV